MNLRKITAVKMPYFILEAVANSGFLPGDDILKKASLFDPDFKPPFVMENLTIYGLTLINAKIFQDKLNTIKSYDPRFKQLIDPPKRFKLVTQLLIDFSKQLIDPTVKEEISKNGTVYTKNRKLTFEIYNNNSLTQLLARCPQSNLLYGIQLAENEAYIGEFDNDGKVVGNCSYFSCKKNTDTYEYYNIKFDQNSKIERTKKSSLLRIRRFKTIIEIPKAKINPSGDPEVGRHKNVTIKLPDQRIVIFTEATYNDQGTLSGHCKDINNPEKEKFLLIDREGNIHEYIDPIINPEENLPSGPFSEGKRGIGNGTFHTKYFSQTRWRSG